MKTGISDDERGGEKGERPVKRPFPKNVLETDKKQEARRGGRKSDPRRGRIRREKLRRGGEELQR